MSTLLAPSREAKLFCNFNEHHLRANKKKINKNFQNKKIYLGGDKKAKERNVTEDECPQIAAQHVVEFVVLHLCVCKDRTFYQKINIKKTKQKQSTPSSLIDLSADKTLCRVITVGQPEGSHSVHNNWRKRNKGEWLNQLISWSIKTRLNGHFSTCRSQVTLPPKRAIGWSSKQSQTLKVEPHHVETKWNKYADDRKKKKHQ